MINEREVGSSGNHRYGQQGVSTTTPNPQPVEFLYRLEFSHVSVIGSNVVLIITHLFCTLGYNPILIYLLFIYFYIFPVLSIGSSFRGYFVPLTYPRNYVFVFPQYIF